MRTDMVYLSETRRSEDRILRTLFRIWIILLAVVLLAGCLACSRSGAKTGAGGETIDFGFSDATDGVPNGWHVESYEGGYRIASEDGAFGFETDGEDDCRLCRTVDVNPGTRYVFSADVRTENVRDGQGATLSIDNFAIDGSYIYSEGLFGTNDWTSLVLAFRTADSQEAVMLALRLGGYSAESDGAVWFRNVRLEQSDNAPVAFQNLAPDTDAEDEEDRTTEDYENVFTVIFWAGAIAAIALLFGIRPRANRIAHSEEPVPKKYQRFWILVAIGLVVRFVLCAIYKGHATDMLCWQGWGGMIAANGPAAFYVGNWCDYPPGYMLVCGLLYSVASLFPEGAFRLFVYMVPAFLCDVLSGFLILNRAKRFSLGDKPALLLAGLIVLNPAAVFLSGAWGQIDSILTVLLIGTFLILNMSREKPYYRLLAGLLYGLAIVMKWQALIFGPVLALLYVMTGVDQYGTKRFTKHVLWSILAVFGAVGVLLLFSALFRGEGMDLLWMVERFQSASGGYDYASIEAYNYMTLFGGNWNKAGNALFGSASVGGMILKVNELFSKVALLVGFSTLVLRAWNEMRTRKDDRPNRAFFELLTAAVFSTLMYLLGFVAKGFVSDSAFLNALFSAIAAFPLYGIGMIVLFLYIMNRERDGRSFADWVKAGGATVTGFLTLLIALSVFGLTFLLGTIMKLFGATLSWHVFGVIGIVGAGALTAALFVLYWNRHRKAGYSLYENRGLIFLLAACFCVWVFTFGHYMHERYIFPALMLLLFAYAYDRDPHKLTAFCMLTVTTFLNEMMAMFVVSDGAKDLIRGGVIHNQLIAVISLLEFCAVMYFTVICFRKAFLFDPKDYADEGLPEENGDKELPEENGDKELPEENEDAGLSETGVPIGGEPNAQ